MELVVRRVGCAERGVIEDGKFFPNVLHIDLHLLHGAVEDAFGLLYGERNLFRHEVAVIDWYPGPEKKNKERSINE